MDENIRDFLSGCKVKEGMDISELKALARECRLMVSDIEEEMIMPLEERESEIKCRIEELEKEVEKG